MVNLKKIKIMKKLLLFIALTSTLTTFSQNYNDSAGCRQTITMYRKIESKLQSSITAQSNTLKSKNSEISLLNETIIKNNKNIKKQKIYKWLSIVGNVGLACYIIKTK